MKGKALSQTMYEVANHCQCILQEGVQIATLGSIYSSEYIVQDYNNQCLMRQGIQELSYLYRRQAVVSSAWETVNHLICIRQGYLCCVRKQSCWSSLVLLTHFSGQCFTIGCTLNNQYLKDMLCCVFSFYFLQTEKII